jgi:orotate phosphoribosyltransferase
MIGKVRVASSNGAVVVVPVADKMTSGASAANSAACLRRVSAFVVAQRMSIRRLRPSIQPNCASACRNAPVRA